MSNKSHSIEFSGRHSKGDEFPTPAGQEPASTAEHTANASWKALFYFAPGENLRILLPAILTAILSGAVTPASSFLTGQILDRFIAFSGNHESLGYFQNRVNQYLLYFLFVALASWMIHTANLTLWIAFGESQAWRTKTRVFKCLLGKDLEWYDQQEQSIPAMLSRINISVRELQLAVSQPFATLIGQATASILSLALALATSWDLTLVILSVSPLLVIVIMWLSSRVQKHMRKQSRHSVDAFARSNTAISAIEVVKCHNAQNFELIEYSARTRKAAQYHSRVGRLLALQMSSTLLLSSVMCILGFYYGAILVSKHGKTPGTVITTFLSTIGAFHALQAILPQLNTLDRGAHAGQHLRTLRGGSTEGASEPTEDPQGYCRGSIQLRDVTFAYPSNPTQQVLDHISMSISAGQMIYIVGQSGSGKSTIGHLVSGLYSPTSGGIVIDDWPLSSRSHRWVRKNVTFVEQTSFLFEGSIHQNVAMGKPDGVEASNDEILAAIEFSLLRSMVAALPNGLETNVGTNMSALSGGQQQRMAIARARLRDTPILILDESTSALDSISRTLLIEAITSWRRGKTTIIITHEVDSISPEDQVYVLESGRIAVAGLRRDIEDSPVSPWKRSVDSTYARKFGHSGLPSSAPKHSHRAERRSAHGSSTLARPSPIISSVRDTWSGRLADDLQNNVALSTPVLGRTSLLIPRPLCNAGDPTAVDGTQLTRRVYEDVLDSDDEDFQVLSEKIIEEAGRVAALSRVCAMSRLDCSQAVQAICPTASVATPTKYESRASKQSLMQIMLSIWPVLGRSSRVLLVLGIWGATVHAASAPAFSYLLSKLVQTYAEVNNGHPRAQRYTYFMVAVASIDATHTYLFRLCFERVAQEWVDAHRLRAMQRILDQPRKFFDHEDNHTSRLCGTLHYGAEEMRTILGRFAAMTYVAVMMTIISVVWALIASWKTTLLCLLVVPYIWATSRLFMRVSGSWAIRSNDTFEKSVALFTETISKLKTVKTLTLESKFWCRYVERTDEALVIGLKRAGYSGLAYGLSDSAGVLATVFVLFVGTRLVVSGGNIDGVITVFTVLLFSIGQVGIVMTFIPQIGNAQDVAARLLRLSSLQANCHEEQGSLELMDSGDIAFEQVSFSYPSRPDSLVLRNVSLHIPTASLTAIVGSSGSGKSTLFSLLLKLYSIKSHGSCVPGSIKVGHRDLKTILTSSLRQSVVMVPQGPTIFATTIARNIAYGLADDSPYNNMDHIMHAACLANIHDFIVSLPLGYSTVIGNNGDGMGLSGGQIQRVIIARALIRRPRVLLLDEPTSALDSTLAAMIRDTLRHIVLTYGTTVIINTHAREMMEDADRVIVLEDGKVAEQGRFSELIRNQGALYRTLSEVEAAPETENVIRE